MEPKSWTPEKMASFIQEQCGKKVAELLEPLQRQVTDYGTWINGNKGAGPHVDPLGPHSEKGLVFAGVVAALAAGKGDLDKSVEMLKKLKDPRQADVQKALEASTATAGGVLVQEQISSDFIDLLTPRAVVRSFGTVVVPMDSGGMSVPKLTAASSAYYIGESMDPTPSQQSFGMKRLTARKLAVMIAVSNDLLRRGGPRVAAIVRNDALRSAGLKEDVSFIRSPGTEFTPKGLRYQAAASNIIAATGGSYDLDSITADLGNLILALENANVFFSNPGWIFSPTTAMALMTVRDGLGQYAFRAEMMTGKFWGWPFKKTTQVPANLGNDGDESEVYIADFDEIIIGDTLKLEVALSQDATIRDGNGNLQSLFGQDQTGMRVLTEHDMVARHDEAIGVLTGVPWVPGGAS